MALKVLNFTDAADTISIGSINWDDGDSYQVYAKGGNDKLSFFIDGTVWMDMGDGNDEVSAYGSGSGSIFGGSGEDLIWHHPNSFDDGVFKMYGGADRDIIWGLEGAADQLYGGAGNDDLIGRDGNVVYGGMGDDTYKLDIGATFHEDANAGYDTVEANFASFNFANTNIEYFHSTSDTGVVVTGDALANKVQGGQGSDSASMGGGADTVSGGNGHDTIHGDAGNDVLRGEGDADKIYGDDGNDMLSGAWQYSTDLSDGDSLYGGAGDDTLEGGGLDGGATNYLYGGVGNDTFQFFTGHGQIVELAGGGIDTVEAKISSSLADFVENLKIIDQMTLNAGGHYVYDDVDGWGNSLANGITGSKGANHLWGNDGADTISSGAGDDAVYGGNHDDLLKGEDGNDVLFGGSGRDWIYGGTDSDTLFGDDGDDLLSGGEMADTLYGGGGNDNVHGGLAADRLTGGNGYDTMYGEQGNDTLSGGQSADYLYGGGEDDVLSGGESGDILYGGNGADRFVFNTLSDSFIGSGIDKIQDFSAVQGDKLDVSAIDANTGVLGNDAFVWMGMSMPDAHKAGNLWGQHFDATAYGPEFVRIYGDVNGDGTADFSFDVQHMLSLDASAFIL